MLVQAVADGLVFGSLLALVALGLTLVFGVLHVLNIAHGEIVAIGAYLGYLLVAQRALPLALAILAVLTVGVILGLALERIAIRPVYDRAESADDRFLAPLITTLAASLILSNSIASFIESEPVGFPSPQWNTRFELLGFSLSYVDLVIVATLIVLVTFLFLLLKRSRFGRRLRAVAENPEKAALLGVNTQSVISITFALSAALAALAGILVAMKYPLLRPTMGETWILRGLVIIVIGGMGNIVGTIVAGLGLGVLTVTTQTYASGAMAEIATFTVLIAFLLVRPHGIFGKSTGVRA